MIEIVKIVVFIILTANLLFIYFIFNPPVDRRAKLSIKNQIRVVRLLFFSGILLLLYGFSSFFKDIAGYFKVGDSYLKKEICTVEREFHLPVFTSTKKTIVCKNGHSYLKFLTFDFYNPGDEYIFYYLPESRVVLKQKLIHSSSDNRNR